MYQEIYELCKSLTKGQKFEFLRYDQYIKIPKVYNQINIENTREFNKLYLALRKSNFYPIERTKNGSIKQNRLHHAGGAYDVKLIKRENYSKGVIITVIVKNTVFVFKCGNFKTRNEKLHGWKCYIKFLKSCKRHGIDLDKYRSDKGIEIKKDIESPIITNFILYKKIQHVNHIDLNQAWPSSVCETYKEFKPVFEELRSEDKLISNVALGFCQSENINYELSILSKVGINGCNAKIKALKLNLEKEGYKIVGINTDGIWYIGKELYHDKKENNKLGGWKHDHIDCEFMAYGDGQYWYKEEGVFHPVARGYYGYEHIKPRELWDEYDFDKAMGTQVSWEWHEDKGFVIC